MPSILIVGCGDIGCILGIELSALGHQVFGLRRHINALPDCITPIKADLTFPLQNLPKQIDYIFYMPSAGEYKDTAYYQAYVKGLINTISAVSKHNIKRLFFISSTSVLGQSTGEQVDETSPTTCSSFSTRRLLQGESLALDSNLPATVVRFGGVYGPNRMHLINSVLMGKASCMENVWSNRIHSADCSGLLTHLLSLNETSQERVESLYFGVDNLPTLSCEICSWLAEQLSVPEINHHNPIKGTQAMRSNKRISNARVRGTGYVFKYPTYKDGYKTLL